MKIDIHIEETTEKEVCVPTFIKHLWVFFLRVPHSYAPAFCVFSATSTTEQDNHNFSFSGLGPKYFNPSPILSKKNSVKHPGLQETDKTFFSEVFYRWRGNFVFN